jgi:cytochrome c oxidase assembly factor CtaG
VSALLVLVPAGGSFAAYQSRVRRLRAAGARWPVWRELSVLGGVLCIAFGITAPLGDRFSGHVIEHLLLGLVGPGLVAAGSPLTLALRSSRPPARRRLRAVLRSRPVQVLTHPAVAVALAMLGPWVVWLSPVDRYQRQSVVVHGIVHLHLVAAGALFAVAVLGLDHTRWRRAHAARLLAAAVALPLHALLGLVILSASTPFLNPDLAPAAGLDDQRVGAALLWVIGDGIATAAMLVVGVQWAQHERRDDRRERQPEGQVPVWTAPTPAEVTSVPPPAPR